LLQQQKGQRMAGPSHCPVRPGAVSIAARPCVAQRILGKYQKRYIHSLWMRLNVPYDDQCHLLDREDPWKLY